MISRLCRPIGNRQAQFWGLTHHAHARTGRTKPNVDDFEARRVSLSRLINYCDQPHPTRERTGSETSG
jgi:hypothetical protein